MWKFCFPSELSSFYFVLWLSCFCLSFCIFSLSIVMVYNFYLYTYLSFFFFFLCYIVGYISTSINDGPGCLMLRCPDPSCAAAVGQDMVDSLASEEDREKYSRYIRRSYIEDNKMVCFLFEALVCFLFETLVCMIVMYMEAWLILGLRVRPPFSPLFDIHTWVHVALVIFIGVF